MPGHLGEIPKSALMLDRDASTAERVDAVRRGARFMALVGIADAAVGEHFPGRTADGASRFFDTVRDSFVAGQVPSQPAEDSSPAVGPRHQEQVFALAARVGRETVDNQSRRDAIGEAFTSWTSTWLEQMTSGDEGADPEALAHYAQRLGEKATRMGALLVLGNEGNSSLSQLGAIGGMEEAANPFAGVRRRIHTYTTALVLRHGGKEGLERTAAVRVQAERALYTQGIRGLSERQRGVFDTVAWFALKAGWVQRAKEGFSGPRSKRFATAHLETAVRGTWPR